MMHTSRAHDKCLFTASHKSPQGLVVTSSPSLTVNSSFADIFQAIWHASQITLVVCHHSSAAVVAPHGPKWIFDPCSFGNGVLLCQPFHLLACPLAAVECSLSLAMANRQNGNSMASTPLQLKKIRDRVIDGKGSSCGMLMAFGRAVWWTLSLSASDHFHNVLWIFPRKWNPFIFLRSRLSCVQ